jgi:zinc-finger of transposase IS204/IS1001/IS1096/IS1165
VVGCIGCGVRAELHGRRTVRVRDVPAGGRPVVLAWHKRIWRCREPACGVRTWTERATAIYPRAVLTERTRAEACRRVGKDAHAVAAVARDLGVGWATSMRAVAEHGTPLVEDTGRLEGVATLGLYETSFVRLMVVKQRTSWGYQTLVREVSDSLHLRRFCRPTPSSGGWPPIPGSTCTSSRPARRGSTWSSGGSAS